ncbi:hypothetical protein KKB44_02995 [Candidatus Micrarchaeota archaeon]|nr:hypothetical protein [Candidatus Micrarchaeota archaeon]
MSKKKEIREMANLIGNSAAHIAILPDSEFALKEASTYTEDAAETAAKRTWNKKDISMFKVFATNRAISEIKRRIKIYDLSGRHLEKFIIRAEKYIEKFSLEHMERK